jgi:hypothetical protein
MWHPGGSIECCRRERRHRHSASGGRREWERCRNNTSISESGRRISDSISQAGASGQSGTLVLGWQVIKPGSTRFAVFKAFLVWCITREIIPHSHVPVSTIDSSVIIVAGGAWRSHVHERLVPILGRPNRLRRGSGRWGNRRYGPRRRTKASLEKIMRTVKESPVNDPLFSAGEPEDLVYRLGKPAVRSPYADKC